MDIWQRRVSEAYSGAVPVADFFSTYMQLDDENTPLESDIQHIVVNSKTQLKETSKVIGSSTVERSMYNTFVEYLNDLVRDFPPDRKPVFQNTWATTFHHLHPTQHDTRPDVASTLPGSPLPGNWDWCHTGSIIEFKFKEDPFNVGQDHAIRNSQADTLTQLLKNALRMLMATRACYTFVVSVFGKRARLFRVDRAGFIVTHPFDWSRKPYVFPEFYWRLYRGGTREKYVLGHDTTVLNATDDEKNEIRDKLGKMQEYSSVDLVKATARSCRVQVKVGEEKKDAFTFGEPIFQSTGLFGRGTRVDFVLIDGKVCVMKDAWRQECRIAEHHFYAVIRDYVKRELEGQWPAGLAVWEGTLELWENDPDHKTITAALRTSGGSLYDRCHDRSVFSSVGTTLDNFESTKQLVQAIRTAIAGHEIAYKAGVLHRDISAGNVLLLSDGGFLLDFDYSAFTYEGSNSKHFRDLYPEVETEDIKKALKDITGTFQFMSIESLRQITERDETFYHSCADDLQGFYWLLVWLILRHADHAHPTGTSAVVQLFDGGTASVLPSKESWVLSYPSLAARNKHRLVVKNHAPLTNLVDALTAILERQLNPPFPPATHESFLAAFDTALASSGWPENDKSREYKLTPIHDAPHPSVNPNVDSSMPPPSLPPSRGTGTNDRVFPIQLFAPAPVPAAAGGSQGGAGGSGKRKRGEEANEKEEEQGPLRRSARRAAAPAKKSPRRGARQRTRTK